MPFKALCDQIGEYDENLAIILERAVDAGAAQSALAALCLAEEWGYVTAEEIGDAVAVLSAGDKL